jgi:hypothetical protein
MFSGFTVDVKSHDAVAVLFSNSAALETGVQVTV